MQDFLTVNVVVEMNAQYSTLWEIIADAFHVSAAYVAIRRMIDAYKQSLMLSEIAVNDQI